MSNPADKNRRHCTRIGLFGVPLDPLPSKEALLIKRKYMEYCARNNVSSFGYLDPYSVLLDQLPTPISEASALFGSIPIPTWLQPKPRHEDAPNITAAALTDFVAGGGCLDVAKRVEDFVSTTVLPRVPGMIGVDHSTTYGAISALAQRDAGRLGLIVLDSHFDGVPEHLRRGLHAYEAGTSRSPTSDPEVLQATFAQPGDTSDPFSREDPLTTGNFLLHILAHKLIEPRNLIVIGIMDYPPDSFSRKDDHRIAAYASHFRALEAMGVRFVPGASLRNSGATQVLEDALSGLDAGRVYISLDADIGALSSVYACRFLNQVGLPLEHIAELLDTIVDLLSAGPELAGFDLMEVDVHKLGFRKDNHVDQTTQVGRMFLESVWELLSRRA
jgi:arginase family enzyme